MIEDDVQYKLTRFWARRFRVDAARLRVMISAGIEPAIRRALADAAESEAGILEAQLVEYDAKRKRRGSS